MKGFIALLALAICWMCAAPSAYAHGFARFRVFQPRAVVVRQRFVVQRQAAFVAPAFVAPAFVTAPVVAPVLVPQQFVVPQAVIQTYPQQGVIVSGSTSFFVH